MLLAGLEALVTRDGAYVVVERVYPLQGLEEGLHGADLDVVVVVVNEASRFQIPRSGGVDESSVRWIVLVDGDRPKVGEWLSRGARAVLPRDAEGREILAAIEAVHAGLSVVPWASASSLVGAQSRSLPRLAGISTTTPLSPREREVLAMLAEGMGNKIVAARLGISEHTVKTHVASIFQKLGADTRAEAVAIGARSGLILL